MRATFAGILAILVLGCGGAAPTSPAPATAGVAQAATAKAASSTVVQASSGIRRSAVDAVLAAGPGAFLQSVTVDEHPVFLGGKFHGFRIAALQGNAWAGVDLKPGDVVTRVNGFSIERPEQAAEAFYSLRVASELRVDYERDGEARELRFGIVDDAAPTSSAPARRN